MSLNKTDYVMIGVNLINVINNLKEKTLVQDIDYDKEFSKIERELENQSLNYVYDALDGKYFIVGKIIKKCDYDDSFPITEINLNSCEKIRSIVKEKIELIWKKNTNPQLLVFSHWY